MRVYIVCEDKYEWNNFLVTFDFEKAMSLLKNRKEKGFDICGIEVWEDEKYLFTYKYDENCNITEDHCCF